MIREQDSGRGARRAAGRKGIATMEGLWIFPLLGAIAGVLAGLLGIGGGLVLVAALVWILPLQGVPKEAAMHAAGLRNAGLAAPERPYRRGIIVAGRGTVNETRFSLGNSVAAALSIFVRAASAASSFPWSRRTGRARG